MNTSIQCIVMVTAGESRRAVPGIDSRCLLDNRLFDNRFDNCLIDDCVIDDGLIDGFSASARASATSCRRCLSRARALDNLRAVVSSSAAAVSSATVACPRRATRDQTFGRVGRRRVGETRGQLSGGAFVQRRRRGRRRASTMRQRGFAA